MLVCFVMPLARFCALAFVDEAAAFATLIGSDAYRRVFVNTLVLATAVTATTVVLAFPVALSLSRLRGMWLGLVLYGVLFPFWVSLLVRTFCWMLLLEKDGPINRMLLAIGVTDEPLTLLFNDFSVVVGMVHVLLPYAVLPLFARMRGIDSRLILASDGLGASRVSTFRFVYLPLLAPGLLGAMALVFLLSLGFFITPALLGGAKSLTIATLIAWFVTERLAWPMAGAAALMLLFVVFSLLVVGRRVMSFGQGQFL